MSAGEHGGAGGLPGRADAEGAGGPAGGRTVRVELPFHLRNLAGVDGPVTLRVEGEATLGAVLGALEDDHPVLRGTIRDHGTLERRDFLRFFACGKDLSLDSYETPLPEAVASGSEPLRIVGALAGG